MNDKSSIKYRFTLSHATSACAALRVLVNKRYLDRNGLVKKVRQVIVTPVEREKLSAFLREANLFVEHSQILERYKSNSYAILIAIESPNLMVEYYTIEHFQVEFGIDPVIMQMVIGENVTTDA